MTKTFAITEDRLLELLKSEDALASLEGAGVDNWSGHGDAYDIQDESLQYAEDLDGIPLGNGITAAEKCFPVTPGIIAHTQEMYPQIDIKELFKAAGLKLNKNYFISILEKTDD